MTMTSAFSQLGSIKAATRSKAEELWRAADKAGFTLTRLYGMGSRGSEHPTGRALDLMITGSAGGRRAGDFLADYLWANRTRLKVKWIIWNRKIRSTSPGKSGNWASYNGGNPHTDHVHVFFADGAYVPPASSGGGGGGGPRGEVWHVDPAKVKNYLWAVKDGKRNNIKLAPGRNVVIVKWRTDSRRTWGVTAANNWIAKSYLKKGRS